MASGGGFLDGEEPRLFVIPDVLVEPPTSGDPDDKPFGVVVLWSNGDTEPRGKECCKSLRQSGKGPVLPRASHVVAISGGREVGDDAAPSGAVSRSSSDGGIG